MRQRHSVLFLSWFVALAVSLSAASVSAAVQDHERVSAEIESLVQVTLETAGANRGQLEQALAATEPEFLPGMKFLLAYMPPQDAKNLSSDFLLEHVRVAYQAWHESPWQQDVDEELFLNYILPYANVSERREPWRADFRQRFLSVIESATTPGAAAVKLNQSIFSTLNVKYSTQRKRADQGPFESIEEGTASCTGLSILLIDACRAVGVPARFVGTPRWSDDSGNHSWVEVWDGEWKFTGAAEPSGDHLNQAWFTERASGAQRDQPMYAIYAVSFRKTPTTFPLVWKRNADPVWATNVTDRYTQLQAELSENEVIARFRVVDPDIGKRVSMPIQVVDEAQQIVFEGVTKDEGFDSNDHLNAALSKHATYYVRFESAGQEHTITIQTNDEAQLFELSWHTTTSSNPASPNAPESKVLERLSAYLEQNPQVDEFTTDFEAQEFVNVPLSRDEADAVADLLWNHRREHWLQSSTRKQEFEDKVLSHDDLIMKYEFKVFGEKPQAGHALFISMHGGGNAAARVNERQWQNQIRLYEPAEGIYLAPRAPTDTWNLWHQAHIDPLFDRIIENFVLFADVDPNRVYLMGYSAGGDGVYQLAPRIADRFAAAAMMAGHPNETVPLGLRNLPFAIYMGENDSAYNRNQTATDWKERLATLREADRDGYDHLVTLYPGKGHWMDGEDASALDWMSEKVRQVWPKRVVWHQDDVTHLRLYWISVATDQAVARSTIIAQVDSNRISIETSDVPEFRIWLHDELVDLDQLIDLDVNGKTTHVRPNRSVAAIAQSLQMRPDRPMIAVAFIDAAMVAPESHPE